MSPGVKQEFISPSKRRRKYDVALKAGVRIGHWLVLRPVQEKGPSRYWVCECTLCKEEYTVYNYNLKTGRTKHCRKCNPGRPHKPNHVVKGQKIGFWTVEDPHVTRKFSNGQHRMVSARCVCGYLSYLRENMLIQGKTKSCGCKRGYLSSLSNRNRRQRSELVQDGLQVGQGHSGL